jgi:hypothetical protein
MDQVGHGARPLIDIGPKPNTRDTHWEMSSPVRVEMVLSCFTSASVTSQPVSFSERSAGKLPRLISSNPLSRCERYFLYECVRSRVVSALSPTVASRHSP